MFSPRKKIREFGPLGIENPSPEKLRSNYRAELFNALSFLRLNSDLYRREKAAAAGKRKNDDRIPAKLRRKACVIAAVKTCSSYAEFKKHIAGEDTVSAVDFCRMRKSLDEDNPDLSYAALFPTSGRPRVYDPVVDKKFIDWLDDERTPTVDKTVPGMIAAYRQFFCEVHGKEEEEQLIDEGIRRHLNRILPENDFRMRNTKTIDAKRCISYDILDAWFKDPEVSEALRNVHPRLLFNADETEINRKRYITGKVACKGNTQPCIVAGDRSGSHVSLFIIVTAAGSVVKPVHILHGRPCKYVNNPDLFPDVNCIYTSNGYMERDTFKKIMIDFFIPHVQDLKQKLDLTGYRDRAVLVVDGHLSRYDLETFEALDNAGIDLIILPAHSSHITQPLDLNLNGIVKRAFPVEFRKGFPSYFYNHIDRRNACDSTASSEANSSTENTGRSKRKPPRKRRRSEVASEEAEVTLSHNREGEVSTDTGSQSPSESLSAPSLAADERLHTVFAIESALATLKPGAITSSWESSGLFPFKGVPPITRTASEKMLRELQACETLSAKPKPRTKNSIVITGLVNSKEGMKRFRELLQQKELKPRSYRGRYERLTSSGRADTTIEIMNQNEDVGDYVTFQPDTDTGRTPLCGETDAECYVGRGRTRRLQKCISTSHSVALYDPYTARRKKHITSSHATHPTHTVHLTASLHIRRRRINAQKKRY